MKIMIKIGKVIIMKIIDKRTIILKKYKKIVSLGKDNHCNNKIGYRNKNYIIFK